MKRKQAKRRSRPALLGAPVSALVIGALVLAGCGGSSGGTDGTTTASAGGARSKSSNGGGPGPVEFSAEDRKCLREKGVELPEFKAGEGPRTFHKGEVPQGGQMPEGGELPEGAEPPDGGVVIEGGPPGSAGGPMSEEDKEAFEECGVEMPEFKVVLGGPGAPDVNSSAFRKKVREYVACVRKNGYELADPNFSGEGPIFEKSESESDAFKRASEKCQGLLGGPRSAQSG